MKLILANFHLPVQIFSISPLRAHPRFILLYNNITWNPVRSTFKTHIESRRTSHANFFSFFFFKLFFGFVNFMCFFSTLLSTWACLCVQMHEPILIIIIIVMIVLCSWGSRLNRFVYIHLNCFFTHPLFCTLFNPKSHSHPSVSSVYLIEKFACVFLNLLAFFYLEHSNLLSTSTHPHLKRVNHTQNHHRPSWYIHKSNRFIFYCTNFIHVQLVLSWFRFSSTFYWYLFSLSCCPFRFYFMSLFDRDSFFSSPNISET